jgi:hypothetical protein
MSCPRRSKRDITTSCSVAKILSATYDPSDGRFAVHGAPVREVLRRAQPQKREAPKWHLQDLSQCGGLRAPTARLLGANLSQRRRTDLLLWAKGLFRRTLVKSRGRTP